MFDNIQFHKFNTAHINADNYLPEYWYSLEDYHKTNDTTMYTAALEADFSISGSVYVLPLRPVSDYAKEHYLYFQEFGLFQSDDSYYTRRSNYNSYLILYTYSGHGYLEYEGKQYALRKGDGFFIDCRKPHFYRSDSKSWQHSDLHINGYQAESFFQTYLERGSVLFSSSGKWSYQNQLEKLLDLHTTAIPFMELQTSNNLYHLLTDMIVNTVDASAKTLATSETMRYLVKYMESNFSSSLTLDFLSEFTNISKYHLCREFKKYTGFSPNDYLIRIRIEQAKILLLNTTISVSKISHLVGMTDENNFTYLFKKHVGTTPGKFRIL